MDLENQVMIIGKEIYEKVFSFVQTNKGDDDRLYNSAILKLSDGRKVVVSFPKWDKGEITISNYKWNKKLERDEGEYFYILPESGYGFLINITFYYLDKDDLIFTISEKENPYKVELTDEEKEIIKTYMEKLYEQMDTLKYDKEATHSISNYTYEAKKQYNIQQFYEEWKKIREINPESEFLPSVETAVNWWVEQLTGANMGGSLGDDFNSVLGMALANQVFTQTSIEEPQIVKFKESLSKALMYELSIGKEPRLEVDYGPSGILANAMADSGISSNKAPFKTTMIVQVNSVSVSAGYRAKYKEIFANQAQEETTKTI